MHVKKNLLVATEGMKWVVGRGQGIVTREKRKKKNISCANFMLIIPYYETVFT